jgi:hypothetical protein
MFRQEQYLSEEERQKLINLKNLYIWAAAERLKDPSNFDRNLDYLRELDKISKEVDTITQPYLMRIVKAGLDKPPFSLSNLFNLANEMYAEHQVMQEVYKILCPPMVQKFLKESMAQEPRIFSFSIEEKQQGKIKNGAKEINAPVEMIYTITFSDKSKLSFKTLEKEKLKYIEIRFNQIMDGLWRKKIERKRERERGFSF